MESAKLTTVTYINSESIQIKAGYLLHTVQDQNSKHFICKIYPMTSNSIPIDPDHYSSNESVDDAEQQAIDSIESQPLLIGTKRILGTN